MITKEQLKRFKTEVEGIRGKVTEVMLAECISYYNAGQQQSSIFIENNSVLASPRAFGNGLNVKFTNTNSKIEAMLRIMIHVMMEAKNSSFSFSFGGRR